MPAAHDPIHEIIRAYRAAILAKDVEGFVDLYAPHVRVFDTWSVWSYEGRPAWREMVRRWFDSLGDERVGVDLSDLQIAVATESAVVTAIVTYSGLSSEGEVLRSMQNRVTWVLTREGARWRIVHEHTSAPVGFDDGKVILQR
ncbi:MAG: SgcJ/EcaC family oxidoreductase [bacterium]